MIETLDMLIRDSGQPPLATRDSVTVNLSIENPRTGFDRIFELIGAGSATYTGRTVNETTAYNIATVFRCVSLISGGIAMMPMLPYRRQADGSGEIATDHHLYPLLKASANANTTAFRFKRLMTAWAVLRGNAIAIYDYYPNGRVYQLTPIHPDRVRFMPQTDGSLEYDIREPGGTYRTYSANRVFHLRGLESSDEGIGLSPLSLARQAMGLSIATEEAGAKLFANAMIAQGYIRYPGKLSDKSRDNLSSSLQRQHGGLTNAHKIPIFEEGMEFVKTSIDPQNAQFLETRKFSKEEIATWFGVPPHMVGLLERATHSNAEQQALEFVNYCLGPWMENWESETEHTLLSEYERRSIYIKLNADVLLRADQQSRFASYATGIQNGFMKPNEARAKENMNPADGGDQLYANGNIIPLKMAGVQFTKSSGDSGGPAPANAEGDQQ